MQPLLNYKITEPTVPKHPIPILLMHGLFGDMNNLGMIARGLEEYRVIQIDARNHGDSFHSDTMTYEAMAQDIIALLDALEIKKVILIGHSMGGKAVMKVTQFAPERVAELIMIDVAPVAYEERRHDEILAALKAVTASTAADRKEAADIMRHYIDEEFVIQFLLKSFRDGAWRFNVPVLDRDYDEVAGWRTIPTWHGPALFIIGGDSPYVLKEYQAEIQAQLPDATATVIAGTGHWVHAQKTDLVLKAIHRFLSDNEDTIESP